MCGGIDSAQELILNCVQHQIGDPEGWKVWKNPLPQPRGFSAILRFNGMIWAIGGHLGTFKSKLRK